MFWDLASEDHGAALPKDQPHAVSIYEIANIGKTVGPSHLRSVGGCSAIWPAKKKARTSPFTRTDASVRQAMVVEIAKKAAIKAGSTVAERGSSVGNREIHLAVCDTEREVAAGLKEDELRLLPEIAMGLKSNLFLGAGEYRGKCQGCDDDLKQSDIDHALFIFDGYASRMGLFVRSDGSGSLISARGFNFDFETRAYESVLVGPGEGRTVAPVTLTVEWRGKVPAKILKAAKKVLVPLQDAVCRSGVLSADLSRAVDGAKKTAYDWLWDELALEIDLVTGNRQDVEQARFEAPIFWAPGVTEDRLQQLIAWNEMVEIGNWGKYAWLQFSESKWEEAGFGAGGRSFDGSAQEVVLEAASVGLPIDILNSRPLSMPGKTILLEIARWSGARGETIAEFDGNRELTAVKGAPKRLFRYEYGEETGHELLHAIAGLTEFLMSLGYTQEEIDKLLDPPPALPEAPDYLDPPDGWPDDLLDDPEDDDPKEQAT